VFVLGGRDVADLAVQAGLVVSIDPVDDGGLKLGPGPPRPVQLDQLALKVPLRASAMALSYESPTDPIEAAMPASVRRSE
jgi:hypothetical protein